MNTENNINEKKFRIRQRRMENFCYQALRAEAFLIALSPAAATAALAVGIFFWFVRMKRDREFHWKRLPYDIPVYVFAIFGAGSIFLSPDPAFSFYNYYNLVGSYFFTYVLAGQTLRTERQLKGVLKALALSALISVLYGYFQFAFGIETSDMTWVDGDAFPELKKRIFSTWVNPNIFAGYLGEVIAMLAAFFITAKNGSRRIWFGAAALAAFGALALTYARGAYISVFAAMALYGVIYDRRVFVGAAVLGAAVLILSPLHAERIAAAFTQTDTSSEMRLALWESTVAMILDHPFGGIGWGAYYLVYPEYDFYINDASVIMYHAHNMYLNYAAEIGVFGAAAYFMIFFGTMRLAFCEYNENTRPFMKSFSLGTALALLTVAFGGVTDDVAFNIPTSMLLWMFYAMAGVLGTLSKE